MNINTYEEAIAYLFAQLHVFQKVGEKALNPNLQNIRKLCIPLGNPEREFPSLHIAGTNGKGSSCHYLASILQEAGYHVGLYTSPHLFSFTERIKVGGQEVEKEWVLRFVKEHMELIQEVQPSFYEISVAMAFAYFAQKRIDIAVIEVGLGGRWDSTNVIQPEASLITNISFDHQSILGHTLAEIAYQKAGIIKENTPAIISETQTETLPVFKKVAQEQNAPIYFAEESYQIEASQIASDTYLDIYQNKKILIQHVKAPLLGIHQQKNLKGVCKTLEIIQEKGWKISPENIKNGIEKLKENVNLQGRWQILQQNPLIVCDVAHNEGGIKEINKLIEATAHEHLHLILGFSKDKDLMAMLKLFPQQNSSFYFCMFDSPRSSSLDELKETAESLHLSATFHQNVNKAMQYAQEKASKKDLLYVGGSTFTVAEIDLITKRQKF